MPLVNSLTNRMNYLMSRQATIAGNIANADTPGYLTRDLTFSSALQNQQKLATTSGAHLQPKGAVGNFKATTSTQNMRLDGNSVKLDEEMIKLNEVQLSYREVTQLYSKMGQLQRLALGRGQ